MGTIRKLMAALAASVLVAGVASATGNTYTWNGSTNNWNVTNYWGALTLPGAGDTGIVNSGIVQMNVLLTNSPTIVINSGGTAKATASIAVTNLVLNGGKLLINAYQRNLGGTLLIQSDSWLEFDNNGPQVFSGVLSGSAGLSITNSNGGTFNGANYFSQNSSATYSGNIHIYGSSAYHVRIDTNGAFGSNNTVYVEKNGTLAVNSSAIYRPVTLNGGTLAAVVNCYMYGTVTAIAPSSLLGHYGLQGFYGQIISPYSLLLSNNGGPNNGLRIKNAANASTWTGGMEITQNWVYVETAGSQGSGPVLTRSGGQLNTGPSSGYDFTGANAFTNSLGGFGGIDMRSADWGNTRGKIELKGNAISPGTNGVVGTLTINAATLSLTNNGAAKATLNIKVSSGSSYDVLKYAPDAAYASPKTLTLTGAVLQVSLLPGITIPGPSTMLYIVRNAGYQLIKGTFDGLTNNAVIDLGGGTNCQITYFATNAVDSTTNDVALFNFYAPTPPVVPVVNNGAGVTNLLATSCDLSGNVTQGTPAPDVYVCYGLTSAGTIMGAWDHAVYVTPYAGSGPFSIHVTQLLPSSNYYYRCFATNSQGSSWSSVSNFVTPAAATLIWTNTAWGQDNTAYAWWQAGNWSNRLPACAGDTGIVPGGRTASPDGDLGTAGDRPTIVAQAGSSLYFLSTVAATPLVLAGGTFDFNYHNVNYGGSVAIVSNSLFHANELTSDGSNHQVLGPMTGGAGITVSTYGCLWWSANNSNLHCSVRVGPGNFALGDDNALGSGPVSLDVGALLSRYYDWNPQALTLTNALSGFGTVASADCTLSRNTIMPGAITNAGVLTVAARRCTLTNATLAINLFADGSYGQLLVTNSTLATSVAGSVLTVSMAPARHPLSSDKAFVLVSSTATNGTSGTNAVLGTFTGLPEGARIDLGSQRSAQISYLGEYTNNTVGAGNDVVLYNFKVPSGTAVFFR